MHVHLSHGYTDGVRVLYLIGRNKDGGTGRRHIARISHNDTQFNNHLAELRGMMQPEERIYASVNTRNLSMATKIFHQRMVEALHGPSEAKESFFRKLDGNWVSALMQPVCAAKPRKWLFDCDTDAEYVELLGQLGDYNTSGFMHIYQTKNGYHVITGTFDRSALSASVLRLMKDDALMLWSYGVEDV